MLLIEQINNLIDLFDSHSSFMFLGLRADSRSFSTGDIVPNSHQWWQDDPDDGSLYNEEMGCWDGGELNGACALDLNNHNLLDVLKAISSYRVWIPTHVYLLASADAEGGNDIGEIIMEDAIVLGEIDPNCYDHSELDGTNEY